MTISPPTFDYLSHHETRVSKYQTMKLVQNCRRVCHSRLFGVSDLVSSVKFGRRRKIDTNQRKFYELLEIAGQPGKPTYIYLFLSWISYLTGFSYTRDGYYLTSLLHVGTHTLHVCRVCITKRCRLSKTFKTCCCMSPSLPYTHLSIDKKNLKRFLLSLSIISWGLARFLLFLPTIVWEL